MEREAQDVHSVGRRTLVRGLFVADGVYVAVVAAVPVDANQRRGGGARRRDCVLGLRGERRLVGVWV